jgi:hypothetical protein
MMYDLLDLAPALKTGENVIAVHVKLYGDANSYYIPPVPNSMLGKSGARCSKPIWARLAGW